MNQTEENFENIALIIGELLTKRGKKPNNNDIQALKDVLKDLEISDEKGDVCAQWNPTAENEAKLKALVDLGVAAESTSLNLTKSLSETNPITLFVIYRGSPNSIRIYSNRKFFEENRLVNQIVSFVSTPCPDGKKVVAAVMKLERKAQAAKASNPRVLVLNTLQRQAALLAAEKKFCVICGGPGTGKTTSVTNFLEASLEVNPKASIVLCAPTGKAKSRLFESVQSTANGSQLYPKVLQALQSDQIHSFTIHKLLTEPTLNGTRPSGLNPLDCDILIVDEGSMIDAELAQKLFNTINPNTTKTLVLGDKHQLAAVGPGSVFADISDRNGPLSGNICELTESMRFNSKSNIGIIAQFILNLDQDGGDINRFINEIKIHGGALKGGFREVGFYSDPVRRDTRLSKPAETWLKEKMNAYLSSVDSLLKIIRISGPIDRHRTLEYSDLTDAIRTGLADTWNVLSTFRPLCAQRKGPSGVEAVNAYCENLFRKHLRTPLSEVNFPGKVIIVRKNDSSGISNGDVAILFPVYFKNEPKPEWHAYIGDLQKTFPVQLLPDYDTAFAITIHQSQGSGFDDVAVFLPTTDISEDSLSASLCTRELLYTGVTRTKKTCQIFGSKSALEISLKTVTKRSSGLVDRLKQSMGLIF